MFNKNEIRHFLVEGVPAFSHTPHNRMASVSEGNFYLNRAPYGIGIRRDFLRKPGAVWHKYVV